MSERYTLIGLGSPFGADAVGLEVAKHLAVEPKFSDLGWRFRHLDRPGTLLISQLAPLRQVLLLDAIEGKERGSLHWLERHQLQSLSSATSGHQMGVAEALGLAEALGQLPPRCDLLGIGMGNEERFTEQEIVSICDKVALFLRDIAHTMAASEPTVAD